MWLLADRDLRGGRSWCRFEKTTASRQ